MVESFAGFGRDLAGLEKEAEFLDKLGLAMKQGAQNPAQLASKGRFGDSNRSPGGKPVRLSKK